MKERENKSQDAVYSFYESLYDRVHHFIFHLFDIGMRVDAASLTVDKGGNEDDEKQTDSTGNEVDELFAAERDRIRSRREECNVDLDRLNDANNKFSIQTTNVKQGVTQTDALYNELKEMVSKEKLLRIQHFLDQHAFDSEGVELDLDDINDSNLTKVIQNQSVIESIKEFIRIIKCMISIFFYLFLSVFKYHLVSNRCVHSLYFHHFHIQCVVARFQRDLCLIIRMRTAKCS